MVKEFKRRDSELTQRARRRSRGNGELTGKTRWLRSFAAPACGRQGRDERIFVFLTRRNGVGATKKRQAA
jgi:hypothetical protein